MGRYGARRTTRTRTSWGSIWCRAAACSAAPPRSASARLPCLLRASLLTASLLRASPPHGRSGGAQGVSALGGAPPASRSATASDARCLGCSGGSPPPKPMTPLPPAMQARVHALGAHGADSDRLAAGRAVVPLRAAPPPGEAAYPAPAHPEHPHRPLGCSLSIHGACPIQCRAGLH